MRIRPINDRVTIEKIESPNRKGLIIIPDNAKDPQQIGRVVDVGPGRAAESPGGYRVVQRGLSMEADQIVCQVDAFRPAMQVKPGDYVLFGKYAGAAVKVNNKDVFMLREDEILAVVEDYEPPTEEEASFEQPERDTPVEPSMLVKP